MFAQYDCLYKVCERLVILYLYYLGANQTLLLYAACVGVQYYYQLQ